MIVEADRHCDAFPIVVLDGDIGVFLSYIATGDLVVAPFEFAKGVWVTSSRNTATSFQQPVRHYEQVRVL